MPCIFIGAFFVAGGDCLDMAREIGLSWIRVLPKDYSVEIIDMPDVFIVTPASLDDPSRYKPQLVFWTAAEHAWDHLDPALPKFDKMPTT
jgi:hypothetical protein